MKRVDLLALLGIIFAAGYLAWSVVAATACHRHHGVFLPREGICLRGELSAPIQ